MPNILRSNNEKKDDVYRSSRKLRELIPLLSNQIRWQQLSNMGEALQNDSKCQT